MDELDRLYRRLVHNIRLGFPDLLTRPFEVQQLYQTLVPYRHHRKELEIETNEEYEIALMRLLSGERDYVRGEGAMQETLRQELLSPNPDTALFRMFANSPVTLAPEALRTLEASPAGSMPGLRATSATPGLRPVAPSPSAARTSIGSTGAGAPAQSPRASAAFGTRSSNPPTAAGAPIPPAHPGQAPASPSPAVPPPPSPRASASSAAGSVSPAGGGRVVGGGACRYCGGTLPSGRSITYCPHCGQNLTVVHCPACGTELELGWKFCVSCGRSVG